MALSQVLKEKTFVLAANGKNQHSPQPSPRDPAQSLDHRSGTQGSPTSSSQVKTFGDVTNEARLTPEKPSPQRHTSSRSFPKLQAVPVLSTNDKPKLRKQKAQRSAAPDAPAKDQGFAFTSPKMDKFRFRENLKNSAPFSDEELDEFKRRIDYRNEWQDSTYFLNVKNFSPTNLFGLSENLRNQPQSRQKKALRCRDQV